MAIGKTTAIQLSFAAAGVLLVVWMVEGERSPGGETGLLGAIFSPLNFSFSYNVLLAVTSLCLSIAAWYRMERRNLKVVLSIATAAVLWFPLYAVVFVLG